jgi:NAD(P)H-flavin reductase/predicted heme/steroid binding protein
LKVFSNEELALHNGRNSSTIYVAYKGLVYDVTTSELFKGGKHYFHDTGIDLTLEMDAAPHLDDVMQRFPVVGSVGVTELIKTTKNLIINQTHSVEVSNELELKFEGRVKLNHLTYKLIFSIDNPVKFLHRQKFGTYFSFHVTINNVEYKRSYSVENIDKSGRVEFLIQEKSGGIVSEHLIHNLRFGDKIQVKGEYGGVDLETVRNKHIYLICTDVGIAPIIDILTELYRKFPATKCTLLVGNRFREDACHHEVANILTRVNSNFNYVPYLSRENFVNFKRGYVTDFLKNEKLEENAFFIVVGWNRMVSETRTILAMRDVKKDSIYVQMYT